MTQEQGRRIDPGGAFRHLGEKGPGRNEFEGLDTFETPGGQSGLSLVRMTSDEVTSMCPITGQPDFETVDITYAPRDLCLESKSLKLYLHSLRDTAAFIESLSLEIAGVIVKAIEPRWVRVDTTQKARGGISIVATSILQRNESEGTYESATPFLPTTPPHNPYLGY